MKILETQARKQMPSGDFVFSLYRFRAVSRTSSRCCLI